MKGEGEQGKVAIRNIRRDANAEIAKLLKDKTISEDEDKKAQTDVQKLTDKYVEQVEKVLAEKEKELMEV